MSTSTLLPPLETDDESVDISRDFVCFLCNGYTLVLGMITLEQKMMRLSTCEGLVLETIPYSTLESVYEEEPITGDTLIFNLGIRQVYASSLLRKEKLVKFFKSLNLYRQDIRLPANAFGFYGYEAIALQTNSSYEQPLTVQDGRNTLMQHHQQDGPQLYSNSNNFSGSHVDKPLFERQRQVPRLPVADNQMRSSVLIPNREQSHTTDVPHDSNLQTLQAMFPDHSVDTLKRFLLNANCDVNDAVSAIIRQDTTNNFNI